MLRACVVNTVPLNIDLATSKVVSVEDRLKSERLRELSGQEVLPGEGPPAPDASSHGNPNRDAGADAVTHLNRLHRKTASLRERKGVHVFFVLCRRLPSICRRKTIKTN